MTEQKRTIPERMCMVCPDVTQELVFLIGDDNNMLCGNPEHILKLRDDLNLFLNARDFASREGKKQ